MILNAIIPTWGSILGVIFFFAFLLIFCKEGWVLLKEDMGLLLEEEEGRSEEKYGSFFSSESEDDDFEFFSPLCIVK